MLIAITNALMACSLVVCGFSLWKGSAAERIGASVIMANIVVATANYSFFHIQVGDLVIDAVSALVMLALALRYASLWLGAVMLVYAAQFGLDAFYMVTERPVDDLLHMVINNANTVLVIIALAAGTALAWMQRARANPGLQEAAP
jgi:hypothetical protein